jgi:hypothetical protein
MVTAKPAKVRSRWGRHGGGDQEGGGEQPARGVAAVVARSQQPTRRREEARAGAHVGDHEDRGEEGDDGREVTHGVARLLERTSPVARAAPVAPSATSDSTRPGGCR